MSINERNENKHEVKKEEVAEVASGDGMQQNVIENEELKEDIGKGLDKNAISEVEDKMDNKEQEDQNAKDAKNVSYASVQDDKEQLYPYFNEDIYKDLPECLRLFFPFHSRRERDMFLNAMLPALGLSVFKVSGLYDQKRVFANLYSINCAPAASGKGVQNFVYNFLNLLEEDLIKDHKEELNLVHIILPGNSSTAAIMEFLVINKLAMINETEIDVLVNTFGQEWGDYTALLRQGYQHETITVNRKDNKYFKVQEPRLSVALAGTENQLINLFKTAENGLLSRFMIYKFKDSEGFRDVRPRESGISYGEMIDTETKKLLPLIRKINSQPVSFDFSAQQWDGFYEFFKEKEKAFSRLYGDSATSSIIRLGLIYYRIAMILSVFRKAQGDQLGSDIVCDDVDFENTGKIIQVYISNFINTLLAMPKEAVKIDNRGEMLLYEELPCSIPFSTGDAIRLAKEKQICSSRSVDNYLRRLTNKRLIHQSVKYGNYLKDCK